MGIAGKMGHVGYSNEWSILPAMSISPHPTLSRKSYIIRSLWDIHIYSWPPISICKLHFPCCNNLPPYTYYKRKRVIFLHVHVGRISNFYLLRKSYLIWSLWDMHIYSWPLASICKLHFPCRDNLRPYIERKRVIFLHVHVGRINIFLISDIFCSRKFKNFFFHFMLLKIIRADPAHTPRTKS